MKKRFILILSILFLCSCTSNTSKQTSNSITYNSTSNVSESINSSIEENSSQSSKSSASSTLVEQEFSTAKMDDLTVDYDGKPHTITPTGYPEGTRITYSSASEFTDVGTHTVSVLLSKNGYKNKLLTATLTIRPINMSGVVFEDETLMYDGNPHSITVKNVPSGTIVSYKRLNGSGNNQFTEKGKYNIQATIENRNYNTLVLTATLTIKGYDEFYGVDSSKQPYQFPKTCFWDIVFPEFLKGNYTALICSGSRSSKDEEINILEHNYTKVVSDGKEFYREYHLLTMLNMNTI